MSYLESVLQSAASQAAKDSLPTLHCFLFLKKNCQAKGRKIQVYGCVCARTCDMHTRQGLLYTRVVLHLTYTQHKLDSPAFKVLGLQVHSTTPGFMLCRESNLELCAF